MAPDRLDSLLALEDGWDNEGAPAPDIVAITRAREVLTVCERHSLTPEDVVADPEGGVILSWYRPDRWASFEVRSRTGSTVCLLDLRSKSNVTAFLVGDIDDCSPICVQK